MRPTCLTLKGFTSFKNETTVPFANLDRFVICGPTGAGKSSLLDALTFALFANAPRVGDGSLTELISCLSKSFSIVLDFQVRDQLYRVTRVRRQSGAGSDQFDKEVGKGEFELVAKGAIEVTGVVERLLGLKYEHFTQAAFLPQGKFTEFLKAKPADRRRLLNDLLRLLIFEQMQQRANRERETFAQRKGETERRLKEDFAGTSESDRIGLEGLLAEQQQILQAAEEVLPGLQERRDALRRAREQTVQLEEKTRELAGRREREPAMNALRRELEAASRATPVVPLLDQADLRKQELAARQQELDEATPVRDQRQAEYSKAQKALSKAADNAARLPSLKERLKQLAEMVGKVPLRDQLAERVNEARQRQKHLNIEAARLLEDSQTLRTELASLTETLQQARDRLAAIGYDAKRHRHLQAVCETAIRLQEERRQIAQALERARQDGIAAQAAESAAAKSELIATQTEQDKQQSLKRKELAEQALSAAENAHRAAHLRAGLQVRQPCPVCRRKVTELPSEEPVPELEECRHAADAATKEYARVEKMSAQKAQLAAAAQATARAARQSAHASEADTSGRQATLLKQQKTLENNVSDLLDGAAGKYIEDRILNTFRHVAGLGEKQRHEADLVGSLSRDLAVKQQAKTAKDNEVTQTARQAGDLAESIAKDEDALERVRLEIRNASGTDDPGPERNRVQSEIDRLERDVKEATRAESEAKTCVLLAQDKVTTCSREAGDTERKAKTARATAEQALRGAGFADSAAARGAFRDADQLTTLQEQVSEHDNQIRILNATITDLEDELKGGRVSEDESNHAQAEYDAYQHRKEDADRQAGVLRHRIQEMTKKLAKAEMLRAECLEQSRHHDIYRQLSQDLRSDRFQAFLLEETLGSLVHDASTYLGRLTGERYALAFENDRMMVVDNDNAGEQRGIDTLSGGETFQASLALALGLSEQVQKSVGAVHLDCLFIDEGFGALDPETLRTVSDAIQGLQTGGRMVGIITHVPELKEEFGQRIIVSKEGGVSTVRLDVT